MTFGYARVSTKTQARDGNSLDAQQAALTAAGAEKIYTDTFTGTKIERPEFDRLRAQLRRGDVLIVTKLRDLEPFWELGQKMDRGIPYWTGHGAYTGDEVQILCICLSKYEIETLQQEVQKIDSHAFFMMQEGVHTRGNFKRHLNP